MRRDDLSSEHELIKDDQKAAARSLGDLSLSQVRDVYWLYAANLKGGYPKPTARSGSGCCSSRTWNLTLYGSG